MKTEGLYRGRDFYRQFHVEVRHQNQNVWHIFVKLLKIRLNLFLKLGKFLLLWLCSHYKCLTTYKNPDISSRYFQKILKNLAKFFLCELFYVHILSLRTFQNQL